MKQKIITFVSYKNQDRMISVRLTALALASAYAVSAYADISLSYVGTPASDPAIHVDTPASAGLNGGIYVVPSVAGLRITCTSNASENVKWQRFSSLGAAYADDVAPSGHDATSSWLDSPQGDMGYAIQSDRQPTIYIWLVDYSTHTFSPGTLTLAPEQECGRVALECTGSGDEIAYYSINGRRLTLSREITLSYTTLDWDNSAQNYVETATSETLEYLPRLIHADAPLCSTSYTLEGDRFLRAWGHGTSFTSPEYAPHSISAHTETVSDNTTGDNEISSAQPGALGGSAPQTITFSANVTDAAIFHEWQMSRYADFDDITMRASELDFTYTFTEHGTMYVRLYCANSDASCEYYGPTYEISIGESMLKCPNAFTPFNQDGVNDIWKVSYSSIIEFECHIFNRSGRKIISFTDPSQGWDGRYGGKFVPAGAYYYVIKASGADGKDYKLYGDINLIDYK